MGGDKINDYVLKITGGVSLPGPILPSKNIILTRGELSVYEAAKRDNQDGSFNMLYKAKFVAGVDFEQGGRPIRGADKTSKSKKLRGAFYYVWAEESGMDFDPYYEIQMDKLIANLPEVINFLKKL